ncbi:MAG: gamma-glutamyl-gamma-aminobutyrate hydrolase family protein [Candidatus Cloacimonetes bacterium]|nr:gamma-glutamyl-gamma-aminobutyrate hydrolase family protein [Candidatus Cloacimonadota bacterium]
MDFTPATFSVGSLSKATFNQGGAESTPTVKHGNLPVIGISMNYMKLGSYHQFHVRDRYIDAVTESGGLPLPIPCTGDPDLIDQYFDLIDALIIIGGQDYPPHLFGQEPHPTIDLTHPRRVASDLGFFTAVLNRGIPCLGICAGMQLMNIATGGQLIQHISPEAGERNGIRPCLENHYGDVLHPITITGGKWLPRIFESDTITVNSNHHQALHPGHIGQGFRVVATAPDGIIEAIEYDTPQFVLGIQWHPERLTDYRQRKTIFGLLIQQAIQSR